MTIGRRGKPLRRTTKMSWDSVGRRSEGPKTNRNLIISTTEKNIQNNTKNTTKPNKTSLFKYICNRRIVIENFHPLFIALGNKGWGQDKPAFSCVRRSWDWILWRLHQTGCPSLKQASQGSGWITRRYLTDTKMSHVGTWFGGVLGSVGLEVGFYGLRGCVQPNGFYDSI